MNTLQFSITGMHCDACAKLCTMDLQDIPGVQNASVDYETGKAVLESSQDISTDQIKNVIEHDGYGVLFT